MIPDYGYRDARPSCAHAYLLRPVLGVLPPAPARVLDLGCGNGVLAGELLARGYRVVGIDPSESGIAEARAAHPAGRFEVAAGEGDLLARLEEAPFDAVVATEVIEHLYDPIAFLRSAFSATRPGGRIVVTTPYHGYFKNLVLSLADRWDRHLAPFWVGGHIKLWSRRTLARALREVGFVNLRLRGVGRTPPLWRSLLAWAERPASDEVGPLDTGA